MKRKKKQREGVESIHLFRYTNNILQKIFSEDIVRKSHRNVNQIKKCKSLFIIYFFPFNYNFEKT